MNLELLKRMADDGVAKHKAFVELQEAVDGASAVAQYVHELQAKATALKDEVANGEAERAKAQQVIAQAQSSANTTIGELEKSKVEAANRHKVEMARIFTDTSQAQARLAELQLKVQDQDKRVREAALAEQTRLDSEYRTLAEGSAVRIAALQQAERMWQDKLSAAQVAYDQFISKLPK